MAGRRTSFEKAEPPPIATQEIDETATTAQSPPGGDLRIQFTDAVRPDRGRLINKEDASSAFAPSRRPSRTQSVASIPRVLSEKEKKRQKREKEDEKKHVDIDEHLMSHEEVAAKYKTNINMRRPEDSRGLTSEQAKQLLEEHGLNVLTPPKRRHPLLKFLDHLRSLFNLLLIVAGVLEYILLGINYHDNFQNVRSCYRSEDHLAHMLT